MVLSQIILRFSQHAARAAGRIEKFAHGAWRGEKFVIVDEQNVHHEPNHLARREVIAGGLIRQFVEPADEVLEDEAHLLVWHRIRVQIHVAKLGDDEIENVRLAHLLDLVLELKELEDRADVG